MRSEQLNIRSLLLAAAIVVVCWPSSGTYAADDRAHRYYDDAQTRYDKGDFDGAVVQLKNALQVNGGMLAAQALLGRAYLAGGHADAAQDAFEKALKMGVHPAEVSLPLAQALLAQGKAKELLDRFTADTVLAGERPDMLLLRGHAYRQLGDLVAAKQAFEGALAAKPGFVPALRSEAELLIQQGKPTEAATLAGEAVRRAPSDSDAWLLKGLTSQAQGDVAAAMAEYTKAVELNSTNFEARLARTWLLLDQRRGEEVQAEIASLVRQSPRDPRVRFLRANYFQSQGDRKRAHAALNEVIEVLDPLDLDVLKRRAPEYLLIGGLAHNQLGRPERARDYLERYVEAEPRNLSARQLLASILLSLGDFGGALQKLEELQKITPNDPQILALMAGAYMGRQRPGLAVQYLEQALALSGSAPEVHATLGIGLLKSGQAALGLEHLRKAFDKDPGMTQVGFALAALYIRQKDARSAAEVAQKVVQRVPNNAAALNLLGVARVAAGDRKGGREAYTQALQADPDFTPVRLNLGKLEALEGNVAAARDTFLAILKERPRDLQAMYELGILEGAHGQLAEAVRWLEKLRGIDQAYLPGGLALVDMYMRAGDSQRGLDVARKLEELAPRNLNVLAVLGRAYLVTGDIKLAQATFSRMAAYAEFAPDWQLQIARYQTLAGNPQGAAVSLGKALAARPDFVAAEEMLVETDLRRGQLDAAELRAKSLQRRYPQRAVGYRLLGDIALSRGAYDAALASYRSALDKEAVTDNALRIFWAHMQANSAPQAARFMESWLRDHPRDVMAMRAFADAQLKAGDLARARASYEGIVKLQGEDGAVLNNLAIILEKQKDPKALDYAQRAFRMAPGDPAVRDTLGWLTVLSGDLDTGLGHLREARLRDPINPEIRYHLAAALMRAGRTKEARAELDIALASSTTFEGVEDARRLAADLPR